MPANALEDLTGLNTRESEIKCFGSSVLIRKNFATRNQVEKMCENFSLIMKL